MLFRPFRVEEDIFRRHGNVPWVRGAVEFWTSFISEFKHWRKQVEHLAEAHRPTATPLSPEWWACRVCDVMKNYDLAASRHTGIADTMPSETVIPDLPSAEPIVPEPPPDDQAMHCDSDSDDEESSVAHVDAEDTGDVVDEKGTP